MEEIHHAIHVKEVVEGRLICLYKYLRLFVLITTLIFSSGARTASHSAA